MFYGFITGVDFWGKVIQKVVRDRLGKYNFIKPSLKFTNKISTRCKSCIVFKLQEYILN